MPEEKTTNVTVNFSDFANKLVRTIKKFPRLLIHIKGSPDPDAIAGAFALRLLCEINGSSATIYSPRNRLCPRTPK